MGMSELAWVILRVKAQVVSEGEMTRMSDPLMLRTDDLRLLQRLVRAEEQAAPARSRRQANARRVARKLAAMRKP